MSVLRFRDPATNEWKEITTIMGPAGPAGADGYTPIKGTDYFTEADKTELVADVETIVINKGYQTEAQVNALINTALGVIENGTY